MSKNASAPSSHQPQTVSVLGIPAVSVNANHLVVGSSSSSSLRSYTHIKELGDGSFGTVYLCDWHGQLPPNTPLSPMQSGQNPKWKGMRLVAIKRMRKRWEGWDECKKLKEIESLRSIPFHPNIIPLYDVFLHPDTKELYFVFEPMEGNLLHLIRARKRRAFAGGLIASIFRQVVAGLHHIHAAGYFHRDMKPENVLVTTTGHHDYVNVSPAAHAAAAVAGTAPPSEKDVVVVIKLADFGLARETKSKPPYTDYVSTRWYRAPEVLLRCKKYSNPVDMWALGTIMAELVTLRPLFPGENEKDQLYKICAILGDPSDEYGLDARGRPVGGGRWPRGEEILRENGTAFPKHPPKDIYHLFGQNVPTRLIDCIADLLKYDPDARLTARQCLDHPYLREMPAHNLVPVSQMVGLDGKVPPQLQQQQQHHQQHQIVPVASKPSQASTIVSAATPRHAGHMHLAPPPPQGQGQQQHQHQQHPMYASPAGSVSSHTPPSSLLLASGLGTVNGGGDSVREEQRSSAAAWGAVGDAMDVEPTVPMQIYEEQEHHHHHHQQQQQQQQQDVHKQPSVAHTHHNNHSTTTANTTTTTTKSSSKLSLRLPPYMSKRRGALGRMFGGGDKHLPTLDEAEMSPGANGNGHHHHHFKRPTSGSTDSRSLPSPSAAQAQQQQQMADWSTMDKKKRKQAEEMQLYAERQRRALMVQNQREQSRAVMEKRKAIQQQQREKHELEWMGSLATRPEEQRRAGQQQQQQQQGVTTTTTTAAAAVAVAGGGTQQQQGRDRNGTLRAPPVLRVDTQQQQQQPIQDYYWVHEQRSAKVRRREFDDDHSMSSSDVHSIGPLSSISFATVDSDPGPSASMRLRAFGSGTFGGGGSSFGAGFGVGSSLHGGMGAGGVGRMTSSSSLRTSFDDYAPSSSTHSQSLEQQFANGFTMMDGSSVGQGQPGVNGYGYPHASRIEGSVSPPPMQMLSLGNAVAATGVGNGHNGTTTAASSPSWIARRSTSSGTGGFSSHRAAHPTFISIPPVSESGGSLVLPEQHRGSFDYSSSGYAPSPSLKSAINPIFKVPSLPSPSTDSALSPPSTLPGFAHLEAVADGEYPPLSPMSFHSPEED